MVLLNLEVLALIARSGAAQFDTVLEHIVRLFGSQPNRELLERRGSLIVRKLCVVLGAQGVYLKFARVLEQQRDLEFASLMVQNLNLILLTAMELEGLRAVLKRSWCVVPRASGASDLPMDGAQAVPFASPPSLRGRAPFSSAFVFLLPSLGGSSSSRL